MPETNLNENTTPQKTRNIPASDQDFLNVSKNVSTAWAANSLITLIYVTQSEFDTDVTSYSDTLISRLNTGSTRPQFTTKLGLLNRTINLDVENVKRYLVEKFGKKLAPSYYEEFGIVKVGKTYKLPRDNNERQLAIPRLITALTTYGFQNNPFGLTYWNDVKTNFDNYLTKTETIDGDVSSKVGDKNILKKKIKKVLNSLILVIKGNYPDNYKNVLRDWGFQKEKY